MLVLYAYITHYSNNKFVLWHDTNTIDSLQHKKKRILVKTLAQTNKSFI